MGIISVKENSPKKEPSKLNPNKIDIYGSGWDKKALGNNYKGRLGSYHQEKNIITDKSNALMDYHYSIALENFPNDIGKLSEKITDCILCWSIPLYWGSGTLSNALPDKSFQLINIDDSDTFEAIQEIISKKPSKEEIKALEKARSVILDKLNIWEQIYQIINNYNNFLKEYKF